MSAPVTHGADVDALRHFARLCESSAEELHQVHDRLNAAVHELDWRGPDAQRLRSEWDTRQGPAVIGILSAVRHAGQDAQAHAEDQHAASTDAVGLAAGGEVEFAGPGISTPEQDKEREAAEAAWAKRAGAGLLALLGLKAGGPVGAVLGAVLGPRLVDRMASVADDRAARTVVDELPMTGPATAPKNIGEMFDRVNAAYETPGGIQLDVVTRADGTTVAFLYAAGTQTWSLSPGENPNDGSAGVASAIGKNNANRVAMLAVLDRANLTEGTEIVLVGHSQSAKTQMDMAADPYVQAKYTIHSVVSAGASGGQYDIPESINVISVRNEHDRVPLLGGPPERAIHVVDSWRGDAHSKELYADLAHRHGNPEVDRWMQDLNIGGDDAVERRMFQGRVLPQADPGR